MNAYRRHFIRLNMALVGTVLLVTLLLAGVYVARSEYANMRQTMLETLEPFRGKNGSFSYTPDSGAADQPDEETRPPQNAPEREMTGEAPQPPGQTGAEAAFSRCITVFFENGQATVISGTDGSDEDDVLLAAGEAVSREAAFGYLKSADLFYLTAGMPSSAKVSLYPARYLRQSLLRTGACLLAAFGAIMVACYFISRYISGMAVRPVEQAMEREKQFVADVSHDLKTPLAVMQACRHILMENPAQTVADVQPWLDRSDAAMENMKRLIDDMLTLSAMDAAQRLPRQDTVDLSGVVTKAALQMEAMAYDRGVALETDVQEGVAATGDGDALLRVVSGLIENALKYEPENGRIRVTLTGRNRKAAVVVQNFGAVIAPEDLPHVFERFYRGDKARTACQGHGLGLAIIRRTAELMNGKIEVTSTPESGTVFTVTLG